MDRNAPKRRKSAQGRLARFSGLRTAFTGGSENFRTLRKPRGRLLGHRDRRFPDLSVILARSVIEFNTALWGEIRECLGRRQEARFPAGVAAVEGNIR
jgi:hypothetical protein